MAFLFDQRQRLLREDWDANNLSQEIYAMLSPDVPSNTAGPVGITQSDAAKNAGVAPITINNVSAADPAITINRSDGTVITFQSNGTVTSTAPGGQPTQVSGGGGGGSGGSATPVWG